MANQRLVIGFPPFLGSDGDPYGRGQQSKKILDFKCHTTVKIKLVSQLGVPIIAQRQSRIALNADWEPIFH